MLGYLGPAGTFTEQALLTQPDLRLHDLRLLPSFAAVVAGVTGGALDLGFMAIENAIEGTVNATQDALAFDTDLLIQREVVIAVELNLIAPAGTDLDSITTVVSFPHATGQCRDFLARRLPGVEAEAANSTADAVRLLAEHPKDGWAAIGTARAAELYGLEILAPDIGDLNHNQTRFVVVARDGVPRPTGHDKTSLVVFQRADRPGSLLTILQEFAARSINLSRLESRPTRRGLGDYCFLIDVDGHIADELVADCLRALYAEQESIKFLGSYPAAGDHASAMRAEVTESWQRAATWIDNLRAKMA